MIDARQDAIPFWNPSSLGAIVLLTCALSFVGINLIDDTSGLAALGLLMIIQITPLLIAFTTGRLNFLAFVMFSHFMTYSVAKLNQLVYIFKLWTIYPETLSAIHELTTCSILIIASYYLFYPFVMQKVQKAHFKPLYLSDRLLHLAGLMTIFHTYLTVMVPPSIRSIEIVLYFISVALLYCGNAPQSPRLMKFYKFAAVLFAFHHFLRFGMLVYVGTVGGVIFIILCLKRRLPNLIAMVALVLALIILQPIKSWYRNIIHNMPYATLSEKVGMLSTILAWKYFDGDLDEVISAVAGIDEEALAESSEESEEGEQEGGTQETLAEGFGRIGDDSLERVLAWTPSKVPFWGGESYANIPFMFIPRLLWPGKPNWTFWNKFGRTYGFLSTDDYSTSVGVGYLGEAYMNFGYLGMYSCAIFMGLLILIAERLSYALLSGSYSISFTCYLSTVISFGSALGSILNGLVMLSGILFLLRFKLKQMTHPAST